MLRLLFQITLGVAGAVNIALAIHELWQAGSRTSDIRRAFWRTAWSANSSFVMGLWCLVMAKIIPASESVTTWLRVGMAFSCCTTYYPKLKRWLDERRPANRPTELNQPEKIRNL